MSELNVNQTLNSIIQPELTIKTSAPGKVILHGEHSVVYGKLAVAASLGLRTKLTLTELKCSDSNSDITILLKDLNLVLSYNIKTIKQKLLNNCRPELENGILDRPEEINHEKILSIAENFVKNYSKNLPLNSYENIALSSLFYLFGGILGSVKYDPKPLIIKLETDLTISAGTGSSASYLVTLAAAFLKYARLVTNSKINDNFKKFNGENSLKLDNNELRLISKWAQNAERIIHGPASGVDNTICTFGSMVEFRKGSSPNVIHLPSRFRVLLVNSMVPRDTKVLVAKVAATYRQFPTIIEPVLGAMDAVTQSALDTIKELSQSKNNSMVKELYEQLGKLTEMNHSLLTTLDVSHPRLDKICYVLKQSQLHGKLTGAGGGGYAIALVPPYFTQNEIETVISRLEMEGFQAQVTDLGGPGVLIDEFTINL